MSMSRQEIAEERYYSRKDRSYCECGNPDWPGHCPGPENCPCCRHDDEESE